MIEKKNDSTTLVNFRVDPAVKESAEAVLGGMGLSVSAYVGMCLRQVAQDRRVPFTPSVDADFWMAENTVSEAMRFINQGLFLGACKVQDGISEEFLRIWLRGNGMGNKFIYCLELAATPDLHGSLSGCDKAEALAKTLGGEEDDEERAEFLEFVSSWRSLVVDSCREFLVGEGIADDGIGDDDAVRLFDRIVWTPVSAYDNHRSNFSLRFAGVAANMEAYGKVVELSAEKAKADERKNQVRKPAESFEEREDQLEYLKAMKELLAEYGEED